MLSRGSRDDEDRKRLLKRAIKYLKDCFLIKNDPKPKTFDEILKETYNTDMYSTVKEWVQTKGLPGVDRVETTSDGRYVYKPPLPCRDAKSLWKLLQECETSHQGVLRRDVLDSIPGGEKVAFAAINSLSKKILVLGPADESLQVLFVKDELYSTQPKMSQDCLDLWHSVDISQVDDRQIEAQLLESGMNVQPRKFGAPQINSFIRRRPRQKEEHEENETVELGQPVRHIKHNSHVMEVLKDYSEPGNPTKQRKGKKRPAKSTPVPVPGEIPSSTGVKLNWFGE